MKRIIQSIQIDLDQTFSRVGQPVSLDVSVHFLDDQGSGDTVKKILTTNKGTDLLSEIVAECESFLSLGGWEVELASPPPVVENPEEPPAPAGLQDE